MSKLNVFTMVVYMIGITGNTQMTAVNYSIVLILVFLY